jgi:spermidine/putrescine transport system substrate-binding protein
MKLHRWALTSVVLVALVAAVLMLSGCNKKTESVGGKTLYLYNWTYYTPDSVIEKFEKEYGVKVVLDYFASNEDMYAKLLV